MVSRVSVAGGQKREQNQTFNETVWGGGAEQLSTEKGSRALREEFGGPSCSGLTRCRVGFASESGGWEDMKCGRAEGPRDEAASRLEDSRERQPVVPKIAVAKAVGMAVPGTVQKGSGWRKLDGKHGPHAVQGAKERSGQS